MPVLPKASRRCGMMADREIGVPGAGWPLRAQARTDCRCYQKASRRCGMMADREIGVPGVGWPLRAQARTSACATKGQQISPIEKCSEAGHLFEPFGIAGALHCDFGSGGVDFAEISGGEFDGCCSDVFFQ